MTMCRTWSRASSAATTASVLPGSAKARRRNTGSASGLEEVPQQRHGLVGEHAAGDLQAVVEALVLADVVERAGGAGLLVGGAVHEVGDARLHDRAGAHRAGLHGHVEHLSLIHISEPTRL